MGFFDFTLVVPFKTCSASTSSRVGSLLGVRGRMDTGEIRADGDIFFCLRGVAVGARGVDNVPSRRASASAGVTSRQTSSSMG